MVIKLSSKEFDAVQSILRNCNEDLNSPLIKVVRYDPKEKGGDCTYEIKVRKTYTEPVLGILARYSNFIVPMVKSGVEMLKSMSKEIDSVPVFDMADKAPEECDATRAEQKEEEVK